MTIIVQLLRKRGIEILDSDTDELSTVDLRKAFDGGSAEIETDSDGSRRIRLTDKNDQLTLSGTGELVVIHGGFAQDQFDVATKTVRARTTAKAANQLTKLRLWCAAESGLKQARVVGRPGTPATLAEWLQQNEDESQRLRRQVDAIGLAAEKTHDFSALVFEPGLLADFRKREAPFKAAVAAYRVAETLRARMLAEASKRLTRKARFDQVERDRYLARKEQLSARAVRLYTLARDYFTRANAGSLASQCDEMIANFSGRPALAEPNGRAALAPAIDSLSAASEQAALQKLIEPADTTLQNTVRAINIVPDVKTRTNLEAHFAAHLVNVARQLKAPTDVVLLLRKLDELRAVVADDAFVNGGRIDRYRGLVLRERADVLPLLGKKND